MQLSWLIRRVSCVLLLVACDGTPLPALSTQPTAAGSAGVSAAIGGSNAGMSAAGAARHPLMGQRAYPRVLFPAENPDSDEKAMLGKLLFWDEQLSGDDSTACGSCHRGRAGGSDPRCATELARTAGLDGRLDAAPDARSDDGRGALGVIACDVNGVRSGTTAQVTGRKPPSAFDAMWNGELFWDGRASRNFVDPDTHAQLITGVLDPQSGRIVGGALESQAVGPPMSTLEMSCAAPAWTRVYEKLARVKPLALARRVPDALLAYIAQHASSYPAMFAAAFGSQLKAQASDADGVINAARIAFAIATYERHLTSNQAPWDRWNAGEASALTAHQVAGFEIFMGKANCQACHAPPLFLDLTFHYLGLHPIGRDKGRGGIDGAPSGREGMMKTPSLRNVGLREPGGLTHQGDGPGHNLDSLLTLYKEGGLTKDPEIVQMIDPLLVPLQLDAAELDAMADFLRHGLTDPRVANEAAPFDRPSLRDDP